MEKEGKGEKAVAKGVAIGCRRKNEERGRRREKGCAALLLAAGSGAMEKRREKKRGLANLSARKTAPLISPENKVRRYYGFPGEDKIEAERCEVAMVRVCGAW
ncbi:hypothetical protein HAX54_045882 [Datura stramonium]|uniref:Uncharacterized protein n=1 Tax=Datura stramonium TaxID=4076 RepID=A0ABS8WJY9_DATST|nr:hypothetical protein [Datura stramonium]